MTAAPGWYPAPRQPGYLQWWTGRDWSTHLRMIPLAPRAAGRRMGPGRVLLWVLAAPFLVVFLPFVLVAALFSPRAWSRLL